MVFLVNEARLVSALCMITSQRFGSSLLLILSIVYLPTWQRYQHRIGIQKSNFWKAVSSKVLVVTKGFTQKMTFGVEDNNSVVQHQVGHETRA